MLPEARVEMYYLLWNYIKGEFMRNNNFCDSNKYISWTIMKWELLIRGIFIMDAYLYIT